MTDQDRIEVARALASSGVLVAPETIMRVGHGGQVVVFTHEDACWVVPSVARQIARFADKSDERRRDADA